MRNAARSREKHVCARAAIRRRFICDARGRMVKNVCGPDFNRVLLNNENRLGKDNKSLEGRVLNVSVELGDEYLIE